MSTAMSKQDTGGTSRPTLHRSRSIDDYYHDAHDTGEIRGIAGLLSLLHKKSSFLLCYFALALANFGVLSATASIGFMFAYSSFSEVSQGKEGIISSSFYMGSIAGGFLGGTLNGFLGRRTILLFGTLLMPVFEVLTAFTTDPWNLALCRAFVGLGLATSITNLSALAAEHAPAKHRGRYCYFVDGFCSIGCIYSAASALVLLRDGTHWRYYAISAAMPSLVAFPLIVFFVPESSRFLALHGKYESALKVANHLASSQGFAGSPITLDEIKAQFPPSTTRELSTSFVSGLRKTLQSYWNLYKEPSQRRKIAIVQAMWFFVFMGYGVTYWMTLIFSELPFLSNVYRMSLYFNLASIPGMFLGSWIIDKMPRVYLLRGVLVATALLMALCAIMAVASSNTSILVTATCVLNSLLTITWAALMLATTEVFPTYQRTEITGVCTATGHLGHISMSMMSAFFLNNNMAIGPLLLGCACLCAAAFLAFSDVLKMKQGAVLQDTSPVTPSKETHMDDQGTPLPVLKPDPEQGAVLRETSPVAPPKVTEIDDQRTPLPEINPDLEQGTVLQDKSPSAPSKGTEIDDQRTPLQEINPDLEQGAALQCTSPGAPSKVIDVDNRGTPLQEINTKVIKTNENSATDDEC